MENLVIGFAMLLVIFLVCRDILCWYWKINEIAASLKKQEEHQRAILDSLHAINGNVIRIAVSLIPPPPPEL